MEGQEPTKRYNFTLRLDDYKRLRELSGFSQGNMSYTVRKLIEDAWKAQQKETK